jgi:hypothetical protein
MGRLTRPARLARNAAFLLGAERSQCTISAEATRALGAAVVTLERSSKSAAMLDF